MTENAENKTSPPETRKFATRLRNGLQILLSSRVAVVGLILVMFWVGCAVFAPFLSPYGPTDQDWKAPNASPSWAHPLGTDELGRDHLVAADPRGQGGLGHPARER